MCQVLPYRRCEVPPPEFSQALANRDADRWPAFVNATLCHYYAVPGACGDGATENPKTLVITSLHASSHASCQGCSTDLAHWPCHACPKLSEASEPCRSDAQQLAIPAGSLCLPAHKDMLSHRLTSTPACVSAPAAALPPCLTLICPAASTQCIFTTRRWVPPARHPSQIPSTVPLLSAVPCG